ncbi:MAG: fluoride efflux transporter CrcB [Bacteroidales bacterium]|nr:fluoride efflux transporter CrcB [Candidatus Colimorpha onthohippi]
MNFLWVALGGAIGSMLRYGCTLGVSALRCDSHLATLIVNVVGSFLIGIVIANGGKTSWTAFASVGFCGGFTTFSTFSSQNVTLLQDGHIGQALAYISITLVLCLLATFAGMACRRIH